ncbi:stage III sporulation protein AG [Ectobacillus panaciterrae]|uniref:stage III sporulation protein AG n=1 Tax=Ectobacillus panaciterrae TaxID=363872 RepID=UPI0004129EA0|nr:stage III sporulation protein AG [Ectobacillus panaciterrae]
MNDNKNNIFQKWFKGSEEDERARKKLAPKLILTLLALGILLMFSGSLFQKKKEEVPVFSQQTKSEPKDVAAFAQKNSSSSTIEKNEKQYEGQLKDLLEGIVGVKDVTVVVNLDSTDTKVLEKDRVTRSQKTDETDRDGGKRMVEDQSVEEKPVIVREGDKEAPVVLRMDKSKVRGVAITAKGADNIEVKKMIIEAVTRYLGVPSHRVSVLPKKN